MNKLEIIREPIEKELNEFKTLFDVSLKSSIPLLNEVLGYIRQKNGKMMRPMLVLLMAKLYGKVNDSTLHAALSLVLLHTASLVHDDVVDVSDKRRGQASVNALYDNKVSILVGDYLLATSLRHAAFSQSIALVDLIAKLGQLLSEGEVVQLNSTNDSVFSENVYFDIIRKKTAALFLASAESGAISVNASSEQIQAAGQIGELIGMAFQIKDDIFDYFDNAELGKPTGNDMMEGKLTLPAIYALNRTNNQEMHNLALRIRSLKATRDEIASFIAFVKQEGGIEYADRVMCGFCDKALALLPVSVDPIVKKALIAYIDFVIDREI